MNAVLINRLYTIFIDVCVPTPSYPLFGSFTPKVFFNETCSIYVITFINNISQVLSYKHIS